MKKMCGTCIGLVGAEPAGESKRCGAKDSLENRTCARRGNSH